MARFRNYARVEQVEMDWDGVCLLIKATSPENIVSVEVSDFDWTACKAIRNAVHDAVAMHFASVDAE